MPPNRPDLRRPIALLTFSAAAFVVGAFAILAWNLHVIDGLAAREARLEHEGIRAPGTVIAVKERIKSNSDVVVRFTVDGTERTERVTDISDDSEYLVVGTPVTMLIDPHDPSVFTLPGEWNQSQMSVWAMVIGFVAALLALIFGVRSWVNVLRVVRLLRAPSWTERHAQFNVSNVGRTTEAYVQLIHANSSHSGRVVAWLALWPFKTGGSLHDGTYFVTLHKRFAMLVPDTGSPVIAKLEEG